MNNLAISVRADAGGLPEGALLETIVMHPLNPTTDHEIVTYTSSLQPLLANGSAYWVVAEPADLNLVNSDNDGVFNWYWSGTKGYGSTRTFDFAGEAWRAWQVRADFQVPAFRIEGTLVPEPGTLRLLLGGGLGWWMLRSRSRRA